LFDDRYIGYKMQNNMVAELRTNLVWDINLSICEKHDIENIGKEIEVKSDTLFGIALRYPNNIIAELRRCTMNKNGEIGIEKLEEFMKKKGGSGNMVEMMLSFASNLRCVINDIADRIGVGSSDVARLLSTTPSCAIADMLIELQMKNGNVGLKKFKEVMVEKGYSDVLYIINNSSASALFE
ncbi:Hypothetical protein ORPV_165, partial [Orpheovirus IHUMI-LCC2]